MEITRTSPLTGEENTLDLPVTDAQMAEFRMPRSQRRHIQEIFPQLSADDREFILTGYTKEDWDSMFNEDNN